MRRSMLLWFFLSVGVTSVVTHGKADRQRVENPFFTEWAGGKPVGWSVLGNPEVWFTDSLAGARRTVRVTKARIGDGLLQRVAVEPGRRYYLRAVTGVSGGTLQLLVRDAASGEPLFQRTTDRRWPQEHVGFLTARGKRIDLIFRLTKSGGSFAVDKVTLCPLEPDPTASRVAVPKTPVFYASFDPRWTRALGAINVVSDGLGDMRHLADLRKRGVLGLATVQVPGRGRAVDDVDAAVDALLAEWMRPFQQSAEGRIPGGADGIIIDELEAFEDEAPRLAVWEKALAELRRLYPNKVLAVWGSGSIAAPGKQGRPHARVMRMLEKSADLFMIEIYQASCPRSQRSYGRNLPEFRNAAKAIGKSCPGLLRKTVVCLVTAQNVGMNFDIDARHNFIKWLGVQMTHIPRLGRDGRFGFAGIGQWVSYRAQTSTLVAFERLAREIFLADAKPTPLTDEDARQAIRDPSFEAEPSPWAFFGPADGQRKLALYADTKLPDRHDKKVEHFRRHVLLTRGSAVGGIRQVVNVRGGRSYQVSVYALPVSAEAAANIRVVAGQRVLADSAEKMFSPSRWWIHLTATFTVPKGLARVTVELTDAACAAGESVAYDFIDLTPINGLNEPLEITSVGSVGFDELPRELAIKGHNLLPRSIVRIGHDVYAETRFVSPGEIRVLIPQLAAPGDYDITISRDDWLGDPQTVTLKKGLKITK